MNVSVFGFNRENMERVYRGEPALHNGAPLEDLIPEDRYKIAALSAEDHSTDEIAEQLDIGRGTVIRQKHLLYKQLEISTNTALAGFFPLDPEDPSLEGKLLSQLTLKQLKVIQIFSMGVSSQMISFKLNRSASNAGKHLSNASRTWFGNEQPTNTGVVRVANGIRANYAPSFPKDQDGGFSETTMGRLALPELVTYEPGIRVAHGLKPS